MISNRIPLAGKPGMRKQNRHESNAADPLAILPNSLEGGQVARIKNILRSFAQFAFFQIIIRIARADRDELEHAWVAVTINHAPGAAVPDQLRLVELIN